MIAGQLDLLDALAAAAPEPAPKPAAPTPRPAADMTRCRRCGNTATTRITHSRNLLLLGVPGSTRAFRDLLHTIPACGPCTGWYLALARPTTCRAIRATWTTETR